MDCMISDSFLFLRAFLQSAYCDTVGVEFTHIASMEQQNWIRTKFEHAKKFEYDEKATHRLLDRLIYAVNFESFLATKYNTTKRFGLEVCTFCTLNECCVFCSVQSRHIVFLMTRLKR